MYNQVYKELINNTKSKVLIDENLKKYIYFKIGGTADIFVEPVDVEDLINTLEIFTKYNYKFYIIGNGTNLLISDEGFRGAIIRIGEKFNYSKIEDTYIKAGAGILLSALSKETAKKGLTGLEFASGIPGFLGGAVAMNAGAYGGEMKDVVTKVKCVDYKGIIYEYSNEEMHLSYRNSRAIKENLIIIETEMNLKTGNKEEILKNIKELTKKRTEKQPLNLPSAGSTFKRPKEGYASKLIEDAGLKGLRYGDAMVSDKHSGFIVNCGNATCDDVLSLMRIVIKTVKDKYDIILEPEVKIIGCKL